MSAAHTPAPLAQRRALLGVVGLGSVSSFCVRELPCPVVVHKPGRRGGGSGGGGQHPAAGAVGQ
jgi:hypothetical protein